MDGARMLMFHLPVHDSQTPLEYSAVDAGTRNRKRRAKIVWRVFWCAVVVVAAASAWRVAQQARYFYWQRQCIRHEVASGTVVYDAGVARSFAPASARQIIPNLQLVAFMHGRSTPRGDERLVVVHLSV